MIRALPDLREPRLRGPVPGGKPGHLVGGHHLSMAYAANVVLVLLPTGTPNVARLTVEVTATIMVGLMVGRGTDAVGPAL